MKYYSEKTKKLFDSEKDLIVAEKEFDKQEEESRKILDTKRVRAKEVEESYKKYATQVKDAEIQNNKLYAEYLKLRDEFVKDYGVFHMSYTDAGVTATSLSDIFAEFFGIARK